MVAVKKHAVKEQNWISRLGWWTAREFKKQKTDDSPCTVTVGIVCTVPASEIYLMNASKYIWNTTLLYIIINNIDYMQMSNLVISIVCKLSCLQVRVPSVWILQTETRRKTTSEKRTRGNTTRLGSAWSSVVLKQNKKTKPQEEHLLFNGKDAGIVFTSIYWSILFPPSIYTA